MSTFTTAQKIAAIKREIALRKNVYRVRVENGRMKQADADFQIAIFEAILLDYEPSLL